MSGKRLVRASQSVQLPRSGLQGGISPTHPNELRSGSAPTSSHTVGLNSDAYTLRRCVERALNLLKQETADVAKVFEEADFDNEAQFKSVFSHMIGITPSLYRERVLAAKSVALGPTGPR